MLHRLWVARTVGHQAYPADYLLSEVGPGRVNSGGVTAPPIGVVTWSVEAPIAWVSRWPRQWRVKCLANIKLALLAMVAIFGFVAGYGIRGLLSHRRRAV